MREVRCPVLVGRDTEIEYLRMAIDRAAHGSGRAVLLMGEAGVGKSRVAEVAAEAARSRGMAVLRGRAAPSPAPAPYRPLAEALLSAFRSRSAPRLDDLPGLRAALPVLLPGWYGDEAVRPAEPSLVLLGETVLALLRSLADPTGVFLVLEDLHWADPGTLDVLDYLLDKLDGTAAVVVATLRTGEAAAAEAYARSVQSRRQAAVVELDRLAPVDVAGMVAASLGQEDLPGELVGVVQEASDGLPFLVEEVLASLVATGSLVHEERRWRVRAPLRPAVPPSFASAVKQRMASLSPPGARVVQAAAVLGDRFEWSLLSATAEAGDDDMVAALRHAAALQLVEEDREGRRFRFRHALTREAVLGTLLAPERAAIARRALAVLDIDASADPGRLELAAQLAETAGDHDRAIDLLLASAAAALRQGALSSAAASAERVVATAPAPAPAAVLRALEIRLDASAVAGDLPRVSEVGDALLARLEASGASGSRRAEVHLRLAQSRLAATDWAGAEEHLGHAAVLSPPDDEALAARWRLLHGRAAIAQHRPEAARDAVRVALETAERRQLDDLLCESFELMGRVERALDRDGAERWFTQALVAAERSGSKLAQVRALLELGIIDLFRLGSPERLLAAEALAVEIGAPALAAQASLHLAILLSFRFDLAEARLAAQRAHDSGVRYRLGLLVPAADIVLVAIDAYRGRRAEAVAGYTAARPLMDTEIEVIARQYLALAALAGEDRAAALEELGGAEALLPHDSPITRSPFRPLLALLLALTGDVPATLLDGLHAGSVHVLPTALGGLARAALAGRAGDRPGAENLFAGADHSLEAAPWFRMVGRRLVAEAAIADAWGSPVAWLEQAEEFFAANHLEALERASRSLLRRADPASRPRGVVDPELARVGITRREADVLTLVAEGRSNKEIAERLYLSSRTVEKHVERLLFKTGTANRAELAALAARLERHVRNGEPRIT